MQMKGFEIMKLLIAAIILLISFNSFSNDYQSLIWDMSKEEVLKLLLRDKANRTSNCEDGGADVWNSSTSEFLYKKVTPYLPNYHWSPSHMQDLKFDHDSKYSRVLVGEGCAIFYSGKFVGFRTEFSMKTMNEVLKIYEEKYGKFTKESSGFLGKDIFYFENNRSIIILGYDAPKHSSPAGFYFSKISKNRILAEQAKDQLKQKPSSEDENEKLKSKI